MRSLSHSSCSKLGVGGHRDAGSRMAETCGTTRGAGNNRAYEDAVNTRISGELQEVESDLPEDIRDRALSVFRAAVSDKATVQQAIEKVQKEALVEVETRFKGQRFKVVYFICRKESKFYLPFL